MSSTQGIVKEFSEASERYEKAKAKMYGAVLKYIVEMSVSPSRCTEAGIMEGLSLPRSIARTILAEYEREGILRCQDMGKSKPYVVADLRKAIQLGYVTFTRQEFEGIVGPIDLQLKEGKMTDLLIDGGKVREDLARWMHIDEVAGREGRIVGNRPSFPQTYRRHTSAFVSQIQSLNPALRTLFQLQSRIKNSETVESLLRMLPHLRQAFCLFTPFTGDMSWESIDPRIRLTKDLNFSFDRDNLPDPSTLTEEDIEKVARSLFTQKIQRDTEFLEPFVRLVEEEGTERAMESLKKNVGEKGYREIVQSRLEPQDVVILKEDLWAVSMGLDSEIKICRFLNVEDEIVEKAHSLRERLNDIAIMWEKNQQI